MDIRVLENSNILGLNINDIVCINTNKEILDKQSIKRRLERHNESFNIINNGSYYKIKNLSKNNNIECWEVVSKDKSEVILIFSDEKIHNINNFKRIRLKGLDEDGIYINEETNEMFSGGALMHLGVRVERIFGSHKGTSIHLRKV